MGFGYKKNDDGIEVENYWEFLVEDSECVIVNKSNDGGKRFY